MAEEEYEEMDDDIVDEDLNEKESEEGKIMFSNLQLCCYCSTCTVHACKKFTRLHDWKGQNSNYYTKYNWLEIFNKLVHVSSCTVIRGFWNKHILV